MKKRAEAKTKPQPPRRSVERVVRFLIAWVGMLTFAWLFWTAVMAEWGIYLFMAMIVIASGVGAWSATKSNPANLARESASVDQHSVVGGPNT